MQLSVIIVNYNVKHFLEQCLCSVQKATKAIETEIIVIDNGSTDGSLEYLSSRFSEVRFIANNENYGFAKACNKGFRLSQGKYILFLNPDTIVPEDCFQQCITFLELHTEAGALGVKMIDGARKFLKESKRSFPSPVTSLYKLFGITKIFPRSKIFSKYHLGNLDADQTHEVDVLAGAFMMIKRKVLEKMDGFDEIFFMYGEDVDLSYRIQKAGYKNYYFAETSIIHFKGESTRKGSLNYVRMFYKAMSIFVHKHYKSGKANAFNFFIRLAIWIRATMTATGNFIRRAGLPIIDAGLLLISFWLMKDIWGRYVKTDIEYENKMLWISFPLFAVFYLVVAFYAGLYDRRHRRSGFVRSTLIATIVLLAGYSLLPERLRFSRAIILFGALLAIVFISMLRWLLMRLNVLSSFDEKEKYPATAIVGSQQQYNTIVNLMKEAGFHERIIGRIAVNGDDKNAVGHWKQIRILSKSVPFRELIFCEGQLTFKEIIESIQQLPSGVKVKFHSESSFSIVGSDSQNQQGEALSTENGFNLADPYNRRLKRLLDVSASLFCLITFPIHLLTVKKPFRFFGNCFAVLLAQKTWVGYTKEEKKLPRIRKAVLACNGNPPFFSQQLPQESLETIDYWYAKDYEPANDLRLIWKQYRSLGE